MCLCVCVFVFLCVCVFVFLCCCVVVLLCCCIACVLRVYCVCIACVVCVVCVVCVMCVVRVRARMCVCVCVCSRTLAHQTKFTCMMRDMSDARSAEELDTEFMSLCGERKRHNEYKEKISSKLGNARAPLSVPTTTTTTSQAFLHERSILFEKQLFPSNLERLQTHNIITPLKKGTQTTIESFCWS